MKWGRTAGLAMLFLAAASADAGETLQPGHLWAAWEFDPGVVIPLVLTAVLFALGVRRQRVSTGRQNVLFWCGWLSLIVALVSPLHPLGEVLFSAHMVQHEILMLISAPLLSCRGPWSHSCGECPSSGAARWVGGASKSRFSGYGRSSRNL